MKTGVTKPEWDTPADGDFARYVERLTAPVPLPPGRAARPSASMVERPSGPAAREPGTVALSPELALALVPWRTVLRAVRAVLAVLIVLHGAALFLFDQGSLPGWVVMGVIWWSLGGLADRVPAALSSPATPPTSGVETLRARLQEMALQRATGKKKTP